MKTLFRIIGVLVCLYAISAPILSVAMPQNVHVNSWVPTILTGLGGLLIFGLTFLNKLRLPNLSMTPISNLNFIKRENIMGETPNTKLEPTEQTDLECLHYLADRLKDNGAALELCRQLSDALFLMYHPSKAPK